mmetsp:Transcript_28465/g.59108  ORF Transcript_28465/g.59108 Transcript_28465/m.59108 type:complete len:362 (+) Transcript_28465:2-1087(+)
MSCASSACDQCGSTASTQGVLGLEICGACGAVRSFTGNLKSFNERGGISNVSEEVNVPIEQAVYEDQIAKARASRQSRPLSRLIIVDSAQRRHRIQRCKEAISLLVSAVRVQDSVHEPALALLLKHCQRTSRVPTKGRRLKKLVCACVLAVSSRQGMGLTIHEVAAQAELPLNEVQKSLWRVCKVNGVRLVRSQANVDALLHRICDSLQLQHQRGAVCAAASRIMALANEGWIATGRSWAFVVCAALVLALRAYHFAVTPERVGRTICIQAGTIQSRIKEIKQILLSLCKVLPWGHLVDNSNLHVYLIFVLDFSDVLKPAAKKLRQQAQEDAHAGQGTGPSKSEGDLGRCCDDGVYRGPPG